MKKINFFATLSWVILFSVSSIQVISMANDSGVNPDNKQGKGLIRLASDYGSRQTADRFEQILLDKGFTVFNRIDHARGAAEVSEPLPPTEIIIFGNPKVGTKLMQCDRSVAIDLPQKALFWEDAEGKSWLAYNDPQYLAQRHNLEECKAVIQRIEQGLSNLAKAATQDN